MAIHCTLKSLRKLNERIRILRNAKTVQTPKVRNKFQTSLERYVLHGRITSLTHKKTQKFKIKYFISKLNKIHAKHKLKFYSKENNN